MRLFGSYARGEAHPDSDVDLLVDVDRPLGLDLFRIEEELGAKLRVKSSDRYRRLAHEQDCPPSRVGRSY